MSFSFEQVSFTYDGGTAPALRDVTLDIPHGGTTAFLGVSGSGKSTALALASLMLHPKDASGRPLYSGKIAYNGMQGKKTPADYHELADDQCHQLRRCEFGIVLQRPYLLPHFTCLDNIAMPVALSGAEREQSRETARTLLEAADLGHLADRLARKVSGGERQRISVLRAMVHNPRVIFADEPVSSLDFLNAEIVLNLLRRWQQGELQEAAADRDGDPRTLILVTHSIQSAWELAENFVVLKHGQVVAEGVNQKSALSGPERLSEMIERGA